MRAAITALTLLLLSATATVPAQTPDPAGFPNVPRTAGELLTPQPLGFSSGPCRPPVSGTCTDGRGAIIAFHGGLLYTVPEHPSSAAGSTFDIKIWNIDDPASPQEVANLGIGPMNMQAHGYVLYDGRLELGGDTYPAGEPVGWMFERTGFRMWERRRWRGGFGGDAHNISWERGRAVPTWVFGRHNGGSDAGTHGNWFYDLADARFALARRGNFDAVGASELWASWDHLAQSAGVFGMPILFGDLMIIASEEQTLSGLAVYDMAPTFRSPGTPPTLLSVFKDGDAGGYWPELWGQGDRLYVFFPRRTGSRGWQIVDISEPTAPSLVADVALPDWWDGVQYVQFQDNFAFAGRYKIDMLNPTAPALTFERTHVDPQDANRSFTVDTSQFWLPLGNLAVSGGLGDLEAQTWRIWAHQSAPDTRGPTVGYHRPRPNQTQWPLQAPLAFLIHETLRIETVINGDTVVVRPVGGAPIAAHINFTSGGQLNVVPAQPLAADTEYEVVFRAGGILDAAGNGIEPYTFRFSTGSTASGNRPPTITALAATPYPAAPAAPVSFSAAATDPDGDGPLQYRFAFGDGNVRDWSTSAAASHAYAQAGRYDALLQVRDPHGQIASRATTVTVMTPPAGPRPTQSSSIATSSDGSTAWVVDPDNHVLARVRVSDMQRTGTFGTGADPRSAAIDAHGRVWVSAHGDDRIEVYDAGSGARLQTIPTGYGSAPFGIAMTPSGGHALVSLYGSGEVARIDTTTYALQRIFVGPTPRAIAITGDGSRALVTRLISPRSHGEVYDIALPGFTLTATRILPMRRIASETSADSRGVPNYLAGIAIEPGGARAWISAKKDNITRGLQFFDGRHELDPDSTVRAQLIPLQLSNGRQQDALVRDLDNSDSPSGLAFSPHGDYLFVAQQGNDRVAVVDILRITTRSNQLGMAGHVPAGAAPQGVAVIGGASPRLLVHNFMGRSLHRTELAGFLAGGSSLPAATSVATAAGERLAPAVLRGKRIFYHASDERMSSEGYISCATCHLDGGSDGRVWDFTGRGEGLRNNIDLRGRAGLGHGRVHWSANFDEIQDFENDIRHFFGGLGFMGEADFAATADPLGDPKAGLSPELDDLAAYVTSLDAASIPKSPHRLADGRMSAAALRGAQVFTTLGCASCHDPERGWRDGAEHDVGTLRTHGLVCTDPVLDAAGSRRSVRGSTSGCRSRADSTLTAIDTPTLLGVWANAPYLHDGSADTLADVFTALGGRAYQAESGSVAGGATPVVQYIDLNAANASHGGHVDFGGTGQSVSITGVDGGAGGPRRIELRLANDRSGNSEYVIAVSANGTTQTLSFPGREHHGWRTAVLPAFPLAAGSNTLTITVQASTVGSTFWPPLALDQIVVSSAAQAVAAQPHRVVAQRPAGEQADLIAFLQQLDGRNSRGHLAPEDPTRVFRNGFEP